MIPMMKIVLGATSAYGIGVDDSAQLWHIYVNAKCSVCNTE